MANCIAGVGSIGSLIAVHLSRSARFSLCLLLRSSPERTKRLAGQLTTSIAIHRCGQPSLVEEFPYDWLPPSHANHHPISTLFVTCKATQVLAVLRDLSHRLDQQSTVVLFQNGAGVFEAAVENIFPDAERRPSFLVGSTTHGAHRTTQGDLDVNWAAQGELLWAVFPASAACENLQAAGIDPLLFDAHSQPSFFNLPDHPSHQSLRRTIEALLACDQLNPSWLSIQAFRAKQLQKLAGNAVVNPLTAILDVRNGTLAQQSIAQELSSSICEEASRVYAAEFNGSEPFEPPHPWHADQLKIYVQHLMVKTAQNVSSTLADMRHKAPETELEFFNGYIHKLGEKHGLSTPVSDSVWRLADLRLQLLNAGAPGQ